MGTVRLFAAVTAPTEAVADLDAAVAPVRAEYPALTWTRSEDWHLTLAFFGEVDAAIVASLTGRLERAATRHRALQIAFAGAGAFGSRRSARVLWTGVTGDRADLSRLADSVAAAGRREGIAMEERKYRPHLTLARARQPLDATALVAKLETYAGPSWTAASVDLVRSHLGQGDGRRPRYETLARLPLTG